jgi:hypothetical protein
MRRRSRRRQIEDHTAIAFLAAGMLGAAAVAVVEDVRYSATCIPLWSSWHFQPASIFAGMLAFVGVLYCLQRINNRPRALEYVEPYLPLLVLSGANLMLKLNSMWLLLALLPSIAWSVSRMRKARSVRSMPRRASGS